MVPMSNPIPEDKTPTQSEAEKIAAEFRDYAYSVSHDLGAPVRAMVEFSKLLSAEHGQKLDEEGKEFLGIIVDNGRRLQAMMEALLDYSRLNTMAKPFTAVHCDKIIENCETILESQIRESGAVIERGEMPTIHADPDQLTQLFLALIDNAIKFQPADNAPQIHIAAQKQDENWKFTIKDNGIGMDPRYTERIFKLFQRLHAEGTYPGTGIGLTLAQKIATRHGGSIWCESAPEQGTTFTIRLPEKPHVAGGT